MSTNTRGRPKKYAQRVDVQVSLEAADLAYLDSLPGASRAAKLATVLAAHRQQQQKEQQEKIA